MTKTETASISRRQALKIITSGILLTGTPDILQAALKFDTIYGLQSDDSHVRDYIHKITNFDQTAAPDYSIEKAKLPILLSVRNRFKRVQKLSGYANFSLLGIDDALKIGKSYSSVGAFTREEIDFLEMLFYRDSSIYGFMGRKPLQSLTSVIETKNTIKVSGSGQYLYKGDALSKYMAIKNKIGDDVILTSGIRGMAKQFYLFLNKAVKSEGNLSKASRSLAPPGYSLHGTGDFDVGQRRYGVANFSIEFTKTPVYRELIKSGFSDFRYTKNNTLGVRFEPWHIKV